jgi:hypothetical protein
MGIAAQLIERRDLGVVGAEIDQEVAGGTAIEANRVGSQSGTE